MNKKEFEELLKDYLSIDKLVDNLNKALREFDLNFNSLSFSRYKELFLDTIKIAMNDKEDWIGYFLFEMNCKFSKKPVGSFEGIKPIYIRNYKDLYNLIIKFK